VTEAPTQTLVDGRYRILDRIGSGGMGDVYRAEDTHLKRDVALKVLHRRFARDEQFVERFRREASSAASLQHPNVVSVYDRGAHDGTYYIAMEHLPGRTLKELVAEEAPLTQERAIDLGIQILQAAGFAHKRGVVHRDFKPQNVIIDDRDEVKVTDFGIARAGASDITETGSILGTAQYLSPEQAQGGSVAAASDVYSIGVILYEMLAGRLPFEGDSAVAIAVKHLTEDPPRLSELRPDIHPGLEAAVMKALAKDPSERWGSAEELVSALQSARAQIAMGDQGQGTAIWAALPVGGGPPGEDGGEPAGKGRRRRRWLIVIGLLLLAGAVAAFFLLRGPPQVAVPDLVGEQLAEAEPQLEDAGFEVEVEKEEDAAPINEVIEQDPEADVEADEGSAVTLVVSDGPGEAKVPDVVGLTEEQAVEKLNKRDFEAEIDRDFSVDVPAGLVISTIPGPQEKARVGSSVNVVVSDGPRQIQVPDVIGESESTATVTLESEGLVVAVNEVESDQPRDVVIDQEPGGGVTVDEGTQVTISVSLGPPREPEVETVTVPSVVGLSAGAAEGELSAAGLDPQRSEETTTDEGEDGVVVNQSPGGGAEVDEGSAVTIVVGRFEPPADDEEVPAPDDDPDAGPGPPDPGEEPGGGPESPQRGRPGG
jgi:serine/threonine-protein kinase